MNDKNKERVYRMSFASVYPHYIAKVEKKGRTHDELDAIISWLNYRCYLRLSRRGN